MIMMNIIRHVYQYFRILRLHIAICSTPLYTDAAQLHLRLIIEAIVERRCMCIKLLNYATAPPGNHVYRYRRLYRHDGR
jgi:hypothetical protein